MNLIDSKTGMTFLDSADNVMLAEFINRNQSGLIDIFGDFINDEVMPFVGWSFTGGLGTQLCAVEGSMNRVVAIGWALPMTTDGREQGINLTYAVDRDYQGRGLATALTCTAFLMTSEAGCRADFVSAQVLNTNGPSLRVARALGLVESESMNFSCETRIGRRSYVGLSLGTAEFEGRCQARMDGRLSEQLQGAPRLQNS